MVKYFLDTCFIFHMLGQHSKELIEFCNSSNVYIISFNLDEIDYLLHKMPHEIKIRWRDFVKDAKLSSLEVPVKPGNKDDEKKYVSSFDPKLLEVIPDPSDAVLLVAAVKNRANVITRDKHHLFTVDLENYLNGYGIQVYNGLPKYE